MLPFINVTSRITNKILPIFKKKPIQLLINTRTIYNRAQIGNREVVGFGYNGSYNYLDMPAFPFPAIRFKEPTAEICALREKERGDWRNLTIEEKKCLYRASFCYTFKEFQAPRQVWKSIVGGVCGVVAFSIFLQFFVFTKFVYEPLPITFTRERRTAQYERQIQMRVNPITGLGSRYDYENDQFKDGYKW